MTIDDASRFEMKYGATWMDLSGNIYVVPGFHDEWIQSHPELVGNAKSVPELIMNLRWVSIVMYSKGYIEMCINDVNDEEVVLLVHSFLQKNAGNWSSVLIMPMVEEGFIQISPQEIGSTDRFKEHLLKSVKAIADRTG
jgi:hypothetical protein